MILAFFFFQFYKIYKLYLSVYKQTLCFIYSEQQCGTYEQLDYWANNFDDFAVSYNDT